MTSDFNDTMATTHPTFETQTATARDAALLVVLPWLSGRAAEPYLSQLFEAIASHNVTLAIPESDDEVLTGASWKVVRYKATDASAAAWTLTAADYVSVGELAQSERATTVLLLGAEAQTLQAAAIRRLVRSVSEEGCDLAVPQYELPPRAGLVNSAILYPISRALFGAAPRFPLAIDLCFSARMAERLASAGQRASASEGLVWPVSEAISAGLSVCQVEAGPRVLPQPSGLDLNSVLAHVTGSLFGDIEAKAAFWQRARVARTGPRAAAATEETAIGPDEIEAMIKGFRMAYGNLAEIWSLVLPPQSLLGLKRLSAAPVEGFVMADALWARIVYDFLIAYRLRTINRGHLLGALTPLYLAWVASHLTQTAATRDYEGHIEAVAAAFEADKPYLVARWRWPDRFNP